MEEITTIGLDLTTFLGPQILLQIELDFNEARSKALIEWTPARDALFPPFERNIVNTDQSN